MPTALIIDSLPSSAQLVGLILKVFEIDTIMTVDGREGVALAQAHLPDIVFLDVLMASDGLNGYETASAIRRYSSTCHIPIIAMTVGGDVSQAQRSGCDVILQRPFTADDFTPVLQYFLPHVRPSKTS